MTSPVKVSLVRLPHAAGLELPDYQSAGAAGVDLVAALPFNSKIVIEPGARECIPTGLKLALPDGFEAQVRPRSGLALTSGVTVLNAPGTIDADYRGEVQVILINHGREAFEVVRGLRIAQLVLARVERMVLVENELDETERGEGGFGSTGAGARPERPVNLLPFRGLLAIAAVIDVALHARAAPVAAKALAARHGLAPRHLETLLQELVRGGILKGHRGPRGGYELARERRRITAAEIVRIAVRAGESGGKPKPRLRLVDAVIEPTLARGEPRVHGRTRPSYSG